MIALALIGFAVVASFTVYGIYKYWIEGKPDAH